MFEIKKNKKNKSAVILNPERSEWVSRSHVTGVELVANDGAKTKRYSAKRDLYGDFAYASLVMTIPMLALLFTIATTAESRADDTATQNEETPKLLANEGDCGAGCKYEIKEENGKRNLYVYNDPSYTGAQILQAMPSRAHMTMPEIIITIMIMLNLIK